MPVNELRKTTESAWLVEQKRAVHYGRTAHILQQPHHGIKTIVSAFTKKHTAKQAAEAERLHRGGNKYFPEILEFEPNNMKSKYVTMALEE